MNFRHLLLPLLICLSCSCFTLCAQEMPTTEPTSEHQWLEKFVGTWKTTSGSPLAPSGDNSVMKGTVESKRLGKLWIVNKMTAKFGDFEMRGQQTVGYDTKKKKFVGTWVDNTSDHIWHYTGTVENGVKLVLEAEGPDMMKPGKNALYRDAYEFVGKDEMKLTSSMKGADGKWITFMTGTAKRSK